jgi:acetoin utilization protein AcuB
MPHVASPNGVPTSCGMLAGTRSLQDSVMKRMPEIRSFMTPFPHAITADAPLSQARDFMNRHRLHHLPVLDGAQLVGVISDRDIKLLLGIEPDYAGHSGLTVREAMATDVYVVDLHTPLDRVLDALVARRIGSALVTRKGRLAGVFTVTDACRELAILLREQCPPPPPATWTAYRRCIFPRARSFHTWTASRSSSMGWWRSITMPRG